MNNWYSKSFSAPKEDPGTRKQQTSWIIDEIDWLWSRLFRINERIRELRTKVSNPPSTVMRIMLPSLLKTRA
jgi:hypothetical protein